MEVRRESRGLTYHRRQREDIALARPNRCRCLGVGDVDNHLRHDDRDDEHDNDDDSDKRARVASSLRGTDHRPDRAPG